MTSLLEELTLVPDAEPGRFRATLSPEWSTIQVPQGGVVAALGVRAVQALVGDPALAVRSATAVFAAPVPEGPVEVEARILRRGRSVAQGLATVRAVGADAGTTVLAVLGATRPGFEFHDVDYPDVPAPEDCPSFRDGPPEGVDAKFRFRPFSFWEHCVEGRAVQGHPPWEDFVSTSSECMYWYRYDEPPVGSDGRLDPIALLPFADTMPGAVRERMGGPIPDFFAPSADLTVHLLGGTPRDWVLARGRARRAGDGYASLEIELWDPETRELVAFGTQMMVFTFPNGAPSDAERVPRT